ncbi:hypothetical protein BA723_04220 [Helicobacter sp. CLO-3]|uniref:type II CRISPR-associated endonuclease Cas1 n=1 Tax=Helicobacter sp. CLO-3 TaxID=211 RepID=UPI000805A5AE|nr:type II CRISPR-associated endonuclease Cas1 [Helicobacter sp. CLO-3]OBV29709.1 hypothetical protein BA723_04220 [Helicobacter sp. CLO-3]
MFDSAFRTLFLSTKAHLSLNNKRLIIAQDDAKVAIPLGDILCVIIESRQITLSSALLDAFAGRNIVAFVCDESHMPSGLFTPFLGHYKSLSVLQTQISLNNHKKSILWQQIIKAKISNQANLLKMLDKKESSALEILAKGVKLLDAGNNESKAAMAYFRALFGVDFTRRLEVFEDSKAGTINAALNYGYAIVRAIIARSICASGLNPALGLFHANQFNAFNLADDMMEPYRIFVDSVVVAMLESGELGENLSLENRAKLANILSARVMIGNKAYPLNRAAVASIASLAHAMQAESRLALPSFKEGKSDGREIYESSGDV